MSFGRSAAGPGGLSINTGAANLFGSNSAPKPSGGLFGSSTSTANPTQLPASSGGLFGAKPASSTTTSTGGGLFGSTNPAATTSTPATGGLFASKPAGSTTALGTATTTTNPAAGGLFGSGTAASTAPRTGGMFGASTATPQPAAGGGLFGASTTAAMAPKTGGLFGGATTTQQPAAGGGLFSASTTAAGNAPKASLFGGGPTTAPAASNPLSGSTSQVIPGVRIDVSNLRGTTRFNDLQEDLQRQIAAIDSAIMSAQAQCREVEAFIPAHGEQVEAIPNDVQLVGRKYDGVNSALAGDANAIAAVQGLVHEDAENAKLSFKAVDNLKLPSAYHTSSLWRTGTGADDSAQQDLVSFFSREADEMGGQLQKYVKNLGEIETHMHSVHAGLIEQLQKMAVANRNGSVGNGTDERLAELAAVLREFEESILQVAGKVSSTREGVTRLQLGDFMGRGVLP